MLLKSFSKYLQKTSPVSSSDLVNEPSDLRSFKLHCFEWRPPKPLFICLTESQDLKGLPFSMSPYVFCIQHSFVTCMTPFRCLQAQRSFGQASHHTSSFFAYNTKRNQRHSNIFSITTHQHHNNPHTPPLPATNPPSTTKG